MNADIEKTQICHKMKFDIKGHQRSHKMTVLLRNPLFLRDEY